jgi:hypothetical protein
MKQFKKIIYILVILFALSFTSCNEKTIDLLPIGGNTEATFS